MISIFDIFSISIGPSSSHTAGPMRAAYEFINNSLVQEVLPNAYRVKIELYGSLALTGKGHKTDNAILMGLENERPETIDPDSVAERIKNIITNKKLRLYGTNTIEFDYERDLIWYFEETLPLHTNGMRFTLLDKDNKVLAAHIYYSIGGGFIIREKDFGVAPQAQEVPYPFTTAKDLWNLCKEHNCSIRDIIFANEKTWRSEEEIKKQLLKISAIMEESIKKGCMANGYLEGPYKLKRRAKELHEKLLHQNSSIPQHLKILNQVNVYALAVAEENAVGGRIITAPTNGAAGVIPAVLQYYKDCYGVKVTDNDIINFLLTAGAIAILYKTNASISGAEVGCQGEVGVACSMAAGALVAVLGGTIQQIEKAAEVGMEHNLGLTCDPVCGLVQIPCIERNAMAAIKAINAANLALVEGGEHIISLDEIMRTMLQTGRDMNTRYKETSLGGLAVNCVEC